MPLLDLRLRGRMGYRVDSLGGKIEVKLYPHQVIGAKFLSSRDRACLFDDMGLGKTVQAIAAIEQNGRALVVCPAIAKSVWQSECLRWRQDLQPVILSGRGTFRWPESGELVIMNYDILPHKVPEAVSHVHVIADEAHYLKTWNSLRTKRFRQIANGALSKNGTVWPMTGTPLMNEPTDLWNVLAAARLENDVFGHWFRFQAAFGAYQAEIRGRGGRLVKVTRYREAAPWVAGHLEKVSLRRRKTDVLLDLPPKTRRTIQVECMTPDAIQACDAVVASLGGSDMDSAVEAAMSQTSKPPESFSRARRGLAILKAAAAAELLDLYRDAKEPVVVLSAHRDPVAIVSRRPGWQTILGGDPAGKRQEIVSLFQAGTLAGVAATIGAAGTGITLTAAADLIFTDLDWSPSANAQAEDRIYRIGQTRGVTITVLEADHELDRAVNRVLMRKAALISSAGIA